jgi:hypothetical protein
MYEMRDLVMMARVTMVREREVIDSLEEASLYISHFPIRSSQTIYFWQEVQAHHLPEKDF